MSSKNKSRRRYITREKAVDLDLPHYADDEPSETEAKPRPSPNPSIDESSGSFESSQPKLDPPSSSVEASPIKKTHTVTSSTAGHNISQEDMHKHGGQGHKSHSVDVGRVQGQQGAFQDYASTRMAELDPRRGPRLRSLRTDSSESDTSHSSLLGRSPATSTQQIGHFIPKVDTKNDTKSKRPGRTRPKSLYDAGSDFSSAGESCSYLASSYDNLEAGSSRDDVSGRRKHVSRSKTLTDSQSPASSATRRKVPGSPQFARAEAFWERDSPQVTSPKVVRAKQFGSGSLSVQTATTPSSYGSLPSPKSKSSGSTSRDLPGSVPSIPETYQVDVNHNEPQQPSAEGLLSAISKARTLDSISASSAMSILPPVEDPPVTTAAGLLSAISKARTHSIGSANRALIGKDEINKERSPSLEQNIEAPSTASTAPTATPTSVQFSPRRARPFKARSKTEELGGAELKGVDSLIAVHKTPSVDQDDLTQASDKPKWKPKSQSGDMVFQNVTLKPVSSRGKVSSVYKQHLEEKTSDPILEARGKLKSVYRQYDSSSTSGSSQTSRIDSELDRRPSLSKAERIAAQTREPTLAEKDKAARSCSFDMTNNQDQAPYNPKKKKVPTATLR